jgi:hypothetical protein
MSQLDWPITKKLETMEAPQNRRFYGMRECLPLWPTYIGEKGEDFGQKIWDKQGAIGNTLGEHIGNSRNISGTPWEHEENIEGTFWEQRKNEKNPLLTQILKEKKSRHLECMLQPAHRLHVFFISKTVDHHFWPKANGRGRD